MFTAEPRSQKTEPVYGGVAQTAKNTPPRHAPPALYSGVFKTYARLPICPRVQRGYKSQSPLGVIGISDCIVHVADFCVLYIIRRYIGHRNLQRVRYSPIFR